MAKTTVQLELESALKEIKILTDENQYLNDEIDRIKSRIYNLLHHINTERGKLGKDLFDIIDCVYWKAGNVPQTRHQYKPGWVPPNQRRK